MARRRKKIRSRDVKGLKYFRVLASLTEHLHDAFVDPKHPNKRVLHYDQYLALLLLYMYSPVCDSLRMVQKATEFRKVQKALGITRFGRTTLSEASRIFDPELLKGVIGRLAERVPDTPLSTIGRDDLGQIITLVDGSCMPALARMLWADFRHDGVHRAAKAHVQFELAKGVPVDGVLTNANGDECRTLQTVLQPGRLYVLDRGYAKYELLQDIVDVRSDFVVRLRDNAAFEVVEERLLSQAALNANVVRDAVVHLGCATNRDKFRQPVRIVQVQCTPHRKRSGKTGRGGPEQGETILIGTSRLDLPAEAIGEIYRQRWAIEIFFRFFKHLLGCRHLISDSKNGLELQLYAAIIACLLIAIWTGRPPTKTVLRLMQFYLMGWAEEDELIDQIRRLPSAEAATA